MRRKTLARAIKDLWENKKSQEEIQNPHNTMFNQIKKQNFMQQTKLLSGKQNFFEKSENWAIDQSINQTLFV